jgi:hypothetical protein
MVRILQYRISLLIWIFNWDLFDLVLNNVRIIHPISNLCSSLIIQIILGLMLHCDASDFFIVFCWQDYKEAFLVLRHFIVLQFVFNTSLEKIWWSFKRLSELLILNTELINGFLSFISNMLWGFSKEFILLLRWFHSSTILFFCNNNIIFLWNSSRTGVQYMITS